MSLVEHRKESSASKTSLISRLKVEKGKSSLTFTIHFIFLFYISKIESMAYFVFQQMKCIRFLCSLKNFVMTLLKNWSILKIRICQKEDQTQ